MSQERSQCSLQTLACGEREPNTGHPVAPAASQSKNTCASTSRDMRRLFKSSRKAKPSSVALTLKN